MSTQPSKPCTQLDALEAAGVVLDESAGAMSLLVKARCIPPTLLRMALRALYERIEAGPEGIVKWYPQTRCKKWAWLIIFL